MPDYISASQLTCYLGCPRRYAYRYLEKAPIERRSGALALGSAVHRALQWLHEQRMAGDEPDAEALLGLWRDAWAEQLADPDLDLDDEERETLQAQGEALVTLYRTEVPTFVPDDVEARMLVALEDPRTETPLRVPLLAYVDAIEGSTLVEVKTTGRTSSLDTWSLQLAAYSLAYRLTRGEAPTVRVVQLVKNKTPKVVIEETTVEPEAERWFCELAAEVLEAIDAGAFYPNPSWRCRGCEYRERCGVR